MTDEREQGRKTKPGPEEERLQIDGDWKNAVSHALNKERPPEGWPDPNDEDATDAGIERE